MLRRISKGISDWDFHGHFNGWLVFFFNPSEKYDFVNGREYPMYLMYYGHVSHVLWKMIQIFETTNQMGFN